jgi:hypothetical protein
LLRHFTDDHRAGGVGQPLQLFEVLAQVGARPAALERRSD